MKAFGRHREVRAVDGVAFTARRRRDHRAPRAQRRRQDHAAARARDADDPGHRQARPSTATGRRPRPLRGAPAHRRPVGRARAVSAADRAREHPLLRRAAGTLGRRARRARRRADPRARHRRDRRPPRARILPGRADEGGDRARAGPRSADDPARRAHQRSRHHEHPCAARAPARAARTGQVPALQLARDAGSLRAVPAHRHPRPRAGSSRPGPPRSCSRSRASDRSRTPSCGCSVPAKDWPRR